MIYSMKSNQIMKIIPVSEPYISPKVQEYVSNAIDEKELSGNFGSYIANFLELSMPYV